MSFRRRFAGLDNRHISFLSGKQPPEPLRFSCVMRSWASAFAAVGGAGNLGRGAGYPRVSYHRHRNGNFQNAGWVMVLS